MDHLIRPFGIELTEEDEIAYISAGDYIGIPFLEYMNTKDGLLQEILGETFGQDDFVYATNSKVVLSTKKLPVKLKLWTGNPDIDQERLKHLHQCLKMAMLALVATPQAFNIKLKICIAATAEVLTTTLLLAANARDIALSSFSALSWGDSDDSSLRVAEMKNRHAWCPAQASWTLRKFVSWQAKIYLSQITKPHRKGAHDDCSLDECGALQINPSTYKSLHRSNTCDCSDIEANQVEVVSALTDDKNALLDLVLDETSNEISVGIKAAQPNSCVSFDIFYDLLTRFSKESTRGGQKRPYLWLDTLCCPVDPQDKLLALAKMPEVYREASQVLILDSSLTVMDCAHLHPIEVISRVVTSGWIFRLWTLNEANLTLKLWVQFKDAIIELGQVLSQLQMTKPATYHFTGELLNEYRKLQTESSIQAGSELWYLTEALKCRDVSEISDEPICIAALLRMDVDVITGTEKVLLSSKHEDRIRVRDARMARIWGRCAQGSPKIPKRLIYYVGDRLTEHGLRWAPSTLLHIKDTTPFFYSADMGLAVPSTNGLIFSSAAYSISVPERVDGILGRASPMASGVYDLLRVQEHQWIRIFSTSEQKKSPAGCEVMALYDIITKAGKGAKFDILKESPAHLTLFSPARMDCLLVEYGTRESQNNEPKTRSVRFLRQGHIWVLDAIVCDFLELLLRKAQEFQADNISQEIREYSQHGAQDSRYTDALKRLLEKVWSLVTQLEDNLDTSGTHLPKSGLGLGQERHMAIFSLLSQFYRNRYLVAERELPASQLYCVD